MCKWNRKPTEMQKRGWQGYFLYYLAMLLSRLLLRLRYINQVNIPQGKTPYLIVANHQTMFDGLWIMAASPESNFRYSQVLPVPISKEISDSPGE